MPISHFTDADAKTIGEFLTFLTLIVTLYRGNKRIKDVSNKVDSQTNLNGNKSIPNGGSMAEALIRIEANSEQGRDETREMRATMDRRLGQIDGRLNTMDTRIDYMNTKMDRHIERTEKNDRT